MSRTTRLVALIALSAGTLSFAPAQGNTVDAADDRDKTTLTLSVPNQVSGSVGMTAGN